MVLIHLVRHGEASAGWDADHDPGLSDLGRRQAEAAAEAMRAIGPLPVIVSPLRRTRETAIPFERQWGQAARIEPRVAELPSPTTDLPTRAIWLDEVMRLRWPQADDRLHAWRDEVLMALRGLDQDTVVISHFVVINVAVGFASGDDRFLCFRPQNCSHTILRLADGGFGLVSLGTAAGSRII